MFRFGRQLRERMIEGKKTGSLPSIPNGAN